MKTDTFTATDVPPGWEAEGNSYVILHAEETVPAYITDEPEEFILPEVTPKPSLPEYVTLYIGKGKKDKINKIGYCRVSL